MQYCPNEQCPQRLQAKRPAEFEDWVERCSDCDAPLAEGVAPEEAPPAPFEWVLLDRFTHASQAALVKARLESEGILVSLADRNINEMDWLIAPAVGWVRVFVAADDLDRARALLSEDGEAAVDALVAAHPEDFSGTEPVEARRRRSKPFPTAVALIVLGAVVAIWMARQF